MNKISLKNALKNALIAELEDDTPMNPAIVYENGKFNYESALHGAAIIIDLQCGCGAFEIKCESDAEFVAEQWLNWCKDEVGDKVSEIDEEEE